MTPADPTPHKRLSLGLCLGYGVGQVGGQLYRDMPALLLPAFLTTVLGVPPAWMGIAIFLPKLWVIFCDPLMGALSDRTRSRFGRRRLYLLIGGVACSAALVALFAVPRFDDPIASAAYVTLMFTVASTAFSVFSVPYLTMASELSDDTHERTRLLAFRLGFTAVGLVLGAGAAQPLVVAFGGGRTGYLLMALVLAAICLVTMLASFVFTAGARLSEAPAASQPLLAQFRIAARNPHFRLLAAIYFIQQLGAAAGYTTLLFYFIYVVGNVTMILPFILLMGVVVIAAQAPWVQVSKRLGKKRSYMLCVAVWVVVTASWYLVHPDPVAVANVPLVGAVSAQDLGVLLRAVIIGVFNSGFILLGFSMLTDTVAWDRATSGVAREGVYSGVWSALEKVAFAAGPLLVGPVLAGSGFLESTTGPVPQSESAIAGILVAYAAIPAILFALSLLLLARYRLDERTLPAA